MTKFWPMAWKCKCRIDLQRIQGVLQRSSKNPRGPAGMDPLSFVILLPTLLFGMHIMTGSLATFFRSLGSGPRDGRVWPGRSLCLEDFLVFFFSPFLVVLCGTRALRCREQASLVVACGYSCPAACGILGPQPGNPHPQYWKADSWPLNHQESPSEGFLKLNSSTSLVWSSFRLMYQRCKFLSYLSCCFFGSLAHSPDLILTDTERNNPHCLVLWRDWIFF